MPRAHRIVLLLSGVSLLLVALLEFTASKARGKHSILPQQRSGDAARSAVGLPTAAQPRPQMPGVSSTSDANHESLDAVGDLESRFRNAPHDVRSEDRLKPVLDAAFGTTTAESSYSVECRGELCRVRPVGDTPVMLANALNAANEDPELTGIARSILFAFDDDGNYALIEIEEPGVVAGRRFLAKFRRRVERDRVRSSCSGEESRTRYRFSLRFDADRRVVEVSGCATQRDSVCDCISRALDNIASAIPVPPDMSFVPSDGFTI